MKNSDLISMSKKQLLMELRSLKNNRQSLNDRLRIEIIEDLLASSLVSTSSFGV